jgi:hypothetical protein
MLGADPSSLNDFHRAHYQGHIGLLNRDVPNFQNGFRAHSQIATIPTFFVEKPHNFIVFF